MNELKPGKESSEYELAKYLLIGGIILAVASSLGKVPFTPDQVSSYLANVLKEAGNWSKILLPYATAIWAFYTHQRTKLKQKSMEKGE